MTNAETEQFNTSTLTSWGAASIKKTPGSPCGLFPGLIFNALPNAYKFNSTYALLPFVSFFLSSGVAKFRAAIEASEARGRSRVHRRLELSEGSRGLS